MTSQEHKDQVKLALDELNARINEARDSGLKVNLWIAGNSPANPTPVYFDLDITE